MHVIANTTLVLGDRRIPIALCPAIRDRGVRFDTAAPDGSEPRQQLVDADGRIIDRADVRRGVRAGGRFLPAPVAELERIAELAQLEHVTVLESVHVGRIPVVRGNDAWWIKQRPGATGALAALTAALHRSRAALIVKFSIRSRERLGAVRVVGRLLLVQGLRFADELAPPDVRECDYALGADVPDRELARTAAEVSALAGLGDSLDSQRDEAAQARRELLERLVADQITQPTTARRPVGPRKRTAKPATRSSRAAKTSSRKEPQHVVE